MVSDHIESVVWDHAASILASIPGSDNKLPTQSFGSKYMKDLMGRNTTFPWIHLGKSNSSLQGLPKWWPRQHFRYIGMGELELNVGLWLWWQVSLGQIANIIDWQSRWSAFSAGRGSPGKSDSRSQSHGDNFLVSHIRHSWTRYWRIVNINEQLWQLCPNMTWQAMTRKIDSWCIGSTPTNMGSKKWSTISHWWASSSSASVNQLFCNLQHLPTPRITLIARAQLLFTLATYTIEFSLIIRLQRTLNRTYLTRITRDTALLLFAS